MQQITYKGSPSSQKVINSLILLNCDEGPFNDWRESGTAIAGILRMSARKVERVKNALSKKVWKQRWGRQGKRLSYLRKADGEFEACLVALSCSAPPQGYAQWSLRLLA